jgi:hypothetical protein
MVLVYICTPYSRVDPRGPMIPARCKELEEAGKPALPAYGRSWFEQRCLPGRSSYLN